MKSTHLLLISALLIASPDVSRAASSVISRKINKVAQGLVKDYKAKRPGTATAPIAVFSLNSSKALARRGVGYALSELLMPHFVKSSDFIVVERTALNKVLEEQRLQITGAIDSHTAVRIGRILGAQVLLLGNVEKLGGKYHVTARLVDAQTGEVVSVGYAELSAALFEDEAKTFLTSIPKRQAIGLYFLYNYRHNRNNVAASAFNDNAFFNGSGTLNPKSFDLSMLGLGVRYFPKQAIVVDVSGAMFINDPVVADHTITQGTSNVGLSSGKAVLTSGYSVRVTAAWVHDLTLRSRTYLGGGMAMYRVNANSAIEPFTSVTPTLKAGYEFKAQERLGLAIFINYDVLSTKGKSVIFLGGSDIIEIGKLSFEPTIALYF